jgi:eukaryotic-like serine/threonine-protein kinase
MHHDRTHFGDEEPVRDSAMLDETIAGEDDEVDRRRRLYAPGTTVGRYVILQEVGAGAMGVVFAAFDPELNRKVALKILHPSRRAGAKAAAAARARLLREAQAIARVSHPHVISVYDVGMVNDAVFVAMEFIEGMTLTSWLEQPRKVEEIVEVFVQAGRGLAAAHRAGLIHRDFKPDNVLVKLEGSPDETLEPQVRVSDFGLARTDPSIVRDSESDDFLEIPAPRSSMSDSDIMSSPLTQVGAVVGTPRYMAPEQHFGNDSDPRSDQFGYCVAFYIALYKQDPFSAPSLERLALAKQQGRIRQIPSDSRVPAHLAELVRRGLSARMDDRFKSMDDLVEALLDDPDVRRRKMMSWLGGIAAVGAIVATAWALRAPDGVQVCDGAEDRLSGVWDAARREAVRERMLGTGVSYAQQSWSEVERQLDAYTTQWVRVHTEACEATHVMREQSDGLLDRRMTCLGSRRTALRALVEVLVEADASVVQRAVQAAAALPTLELCSNAAALLAQVEPPVDPTTAAHVAEVREQLANARVLGGAGKYAEALELARQAGTIAEEIGYMPLVAEALAEIGSALESSGEYATAEEHLLRSAWEATRSHHDEALARAATRLVGVVGDRLARHEEGLRWGELARAVLDRLGLEPLSHASVDTSLGNVLFRMGRYEEAREHYERAIAIRVDAKGEDDPILAGMHVNLGGVLYRQRHHDEAIAAFQRAQELATSRMGAEHPLVGTVLVSLGLVYNAREDYDQAQLHHERGISIFRATMGKDHPFLATAISNLGVTLQARKQHEEAKQRFEEALAMYGASLGERHPEYARVLQNIGVAHQHLDELEEAREHIARALEIRREALAADHIEIAYSLAAMAELNLLEAEHAAALESFEGALAILEGAEGDVLTRADVRFGVAQASWELGARDEALAAAHRAHQECGDSEPAERKLQESITQWLAERGS